jgi:hypothetical protein
MNNIIYIKKNMNNIWKEIEIKTELSQLKSSKLNYLKMMKNNIYTSSAQHEYNTHSYGWFPNIHAFIELAFTQK